MPAQFMPHPKVPQELHAVALCIRWRYPFAVAANSATGLGRPTSKRRTDAPITIAGAFFASAYLFYGGCAWEAFGPAGFLLPRSTNLRTAATPICLVANGGSSPSKRSVNHAHPESVQNLRHCLSSSGSIRITRQRQPYHPPRRLQPQYGQSPRTCFQKG